MRISDWSSDVCSSDLPKYDAIPPDVRRAGGLLRLRKELRVFANLRPVVGYEALGDIVSLKPEVIRGVDVMIVRELNGGLYFGEPRGIETLPDGSERAEIGRASGRERVCQSV